MNVKLYLWTVFGRPLCSGDDEYEEFYEYVMDKNRLTVFFDSNETRWILSHMENEKEVLTLNGNIVNKSDIERLYRLFKDFKDNNGN